MATKKAKTESSVKTIDFFFDRIGKTVTVTAPDGETTTGSIRNRDDAKHFFNAQDAQQLVYNEVAEKNPAATETE